MIFVLALAMFAVAGFASMMGIGGGVLYTPFLVLFGIEIHEAAATSLFLIMLMSISSTLVYRKAKRIDWTLAFVLEVATVMGGFLGGYCSHWLSRFWLSLVFAAVALVAAHSMIRPGTPRPARSRGQGGLFCMHRQTNGHAYSVNLLVGLPLSFIAGIVSGLVGVGGGIIKVPMMVILFGMPMDIAVGTSAFMIGITATAGFAGHLAAGHWDWRLSLLLGLAVFVGAQLGSRVSLNINPVKLRRFFGIFLLAVAALVLWKALS